MAKTDDGGDPGRAPRPPRLVLTAWDLGEDGVGGAPVVSLEPASDELGEQAASPADVLAAKTRVPLGGDEDAPAPPDDQAR
jgi:hypothetical protein